MRVTGGFDPYSYRPRQPGIKSLRFAVLMLQTPLHQLSRLGVYHRDLLVVRMQITSYNHHRSAGGWPTFAVLAKVGTHAASISPMTADLAVPTFTKNVKVGQPPDLQPSQ
ncbi:MAG: hypothetical protein ACRD2U_10465 [Terriglobales bacterium]